MRDHYHLVGRGANLKNNRNVLHSILSQRINTRLAFIRVPIPNSPSKLQNNNKKDNTKNIHLEISEVLDKTFQHTSAQNGFNAYKNVYE